MSTETLDHVRSQLQAPARPRRLFGELEHPTDLLRHLGPNWFATVMGTGIVATTAAGLPLQFTGLRTAALVMWVLAALALTGLGAAWLAHWSLHPENARNHGKHPVMSQFYGAPPMALLTVGAGALLVGKDLIGLPAALTVDWTLWIAGTVLGLWSAMTIPYRMITRHQLPVDAAFGGWLMPIVPPMVSAALGALLIPYTPAGQWRLTMFVGCLAMFGVSLIAAFLVISMIYSRLMHHGMPAPATVPTLWIVLGPLGQAVTAAGLLGNIAPTVLPEPFAAGMSVFALIFGAATWGFAMLWLAIAVAVTLNARRDGLPFNLTWWGFTFPVGTCVTGSTVLYTRSHANLFEVAAVALFALLVAAWATVAVRTARGSLRGTLFLAPR